MSHFIQRGGDTFTPKKKVPILQMARFKDKNDKVVTKTVLNEKIKSKLWAAGVAGILSALAWSLYYVA